MDATISLTSYIAEWLTTFKQTTVMQSTYDRLLTSVKALEGFEIATIPIGEISIIAKGVFLSYSPLKLH